MRQHNKRSAIKRKAANKKAVSSVITTIIISSVLLIILVIASFVSTNILDMQMASTEFEQAKTNMDLLDSVIQDVALRPGAGGYVQFNERTGGIGINETNNEITIDAIAPGTGSTNLKTWSKLISLVYRAGHQVSGAATNITGSTKLNQTMSEPLSFLRVEVSPGIWIKLDYNRVRTASMGNLGANNVVYDFYDITFLRLTQGNIMAGGSGTVNVRVQNQGINTSSKVYENGVTITAQLNGGNPVKCIGTETRTVVMITEISITVAIG
jgi:hypothetical protein